MPLTSESDPKATSAPDSLNHLVGLHEGAMSMTWRIPCWSQNGAIAGDPTPHYPVSMGQGTPSKDESYIEFEALGEKAYKGAHMITAEQCEINSAACTIQWKASGYRSPGRPQCELRQLD